jgi:hypothetical protein
MTLLNELKIRRKVFISYYHADDQKYKDYLEKKFGHLLISKSVNPGDINTDVSADYIKKLIQQNYISDASVLIVLISPKTKCRKHVDWELSAALNKKVGGYSGLAGIVLPTLPPLANGNYTNSSLPSRLVDNLNSKYASLWTWKYATASDANMSQVLETALNSRINLSDKIDNSRVQMGKNT